LLPKLQQYNPQIVRRLNELADMLRADSQVLEQQVDEWAARALRWRGGNRAEIQQRLFGAAPIAMQRRLLRRIVAALSSAPEAVHFRHIEDLRQFIGSDRAQRRCVLPGQVIAEHHRETVLLWNTARMPAVPNTLALPVPGKVDIFALDIRLIADIIEPPRSLSGATQEALLDLERIVSPLQVRFRQPGDRFYPLGAPGSKKLQDFFTDSKIPRAERPYVLLVVSDREIVWVVGYRIAEPFKIRPETKRVVRLRCCARPRASASANI
jgi:tRNA(Ile)-lysidine synthase